MGFPWEPPFDEFGATGYWLEHGMPLAFTIRGQDVNVTLIRNVPRLDENTGGDTLPAVLAQSTLAMPVTFQKRSPISEVPYIRGYRGGQIYMQANGQYWQPARVDLDSPMSRFDPSLVEKVELIGGPYGLRYGPGFGYMNITMKDTPRNKMFSSITGFTTHINGGRVYGRETLTGGNDNWGFTAHYANRTGADYRPGGNADLGRIPGSYRDQNFLGQIGVDVADDWTVEFRYSRTDQDDTEYAAQFFDIDYLDSDAFSVTATRIDPFTENEHKLDAWYNRTDFAGDTRNPSKRLVGGPGGPNYFPVIDRVESAIDVAFGGAPSTSPTTELNGDTDGDLASAGARGAATTGDPEWLQLHAGADIRIVEQQLSERYVSNRPAPLNAFETNMPSAKMINPGIYAELTKTWPICLTTTLGGRLDWVHTDADSRELRAGSGLSGAPGSLSQHDTLGAFFLRNDLQLTEDWSVELSAGYAERAPTLMERYADGIFVAINQSGFTRMIGEPSLKKERLWQIDLGLKKEKGEFDNWGAAARWYYSWIQDYTTYNFAGVPVVPPPTGANLVIATNSDLATLTGFELEGEYELIPGRLSVIGSAHYVHGTNEDIDRPLTYITPLEGRVAVRLLDDYDGTNWGMEFGARMVAGQDRAGFLPHNVAGQPPLKVEESTPGFTTCYLRGYYIICERLRINGGVDNLFDRNYIEHLSLRLPADGTFPNTAVLSPGITPWIGAEYTY